MRELSGSVVVQGVRASLLFLRYHTWVCRAALNARQFLLQAILPASLQLYGTHMDWSRFLRSSACTYSSARVIGTPLDLHHPHCFWMLDSFAAVPRLLREMLDAHVQ